MFVGLDFNTDNETRSGGAQIIENDQPISLL